jgi:eukaryotic-like serine/threonine-protein kinase
VPSSAGEVIGDRFAIEEPVAHGGMGVVYRARDLVTGEAVALKLILAEGEGHGERFAREIRLLAAIDHPRIARYLGHGQAADGRAFLAMGWLEGHDLGAALAAGALSPADSLRVLEGAAQAVAAVHARGIVHRDLKPSNLFLRGGSPADLVLIDFGVARRLGGAGATMLTGASALVGTPHYMAPEQVSNASEVLPAADVFSLGCVFYECLTGARPFDAGHLLGVLARIVYDSPEPLASHGVSVPPAWDHLLGRLLAKQPAARPADGAALLHELAALPPPRPEALAAPLARGSRPPTPAAASDQVLVCVVLVSQPAGAPRALRPDRLDSVRSALLRFGCPIELLADGTLLATVMPRQSATDLVYVAARCAMYLREQLPGARLAVATGRAPLGQSPRFGDAVDRAADLLGRQLDGDGIRLDTLTRGLLDGRFVTASEAGVSVLVDEQAALDDSRPLLGKPTPCVGREIELLQLEGVMASALEERAPKAALVLGPPGIGKSRLRHELLRRLGQRFPGSAVLVGYGDPLTAGSPYVQVGDALRRCAGIRRGDDPAGARAAIRELTRRVDPHSRTRVAEFLGELTGVPFPAEHSPPLQAARGDRRVMSEQIAMAFSDWLTATCAAQPVVLVLEDVQWSDALTLRLLEEALRDLRAPLFVVALGRPEAEEAFPRLLGEQRTLTLTMHPLSNKASELLAREVLGPAVPSESLVRIVKLAAGNALFLEELIRAAAEGKAGEVPETVLAMLQARLSRMSPEARLVLRAASVLGETFWRGGVRDICAGWGAVPDVDRWLDHLVDLELVARARGSRFPAEAEYAFRHALVRDAAAGLLTEDDLRSAHRAAARWLEGAGEGDGVVLARHAEQGGDRAGAIAHYARAAEQSLEQFDAAEALARASKGIACGAEGHALGMLRSVQAAAHYTLASWADADEAGEQALALLPPGEIRWCATVEQLLHVLPVRGRFERAVALGEELRRVQPAPAARAAYLRAVYVQLLSCTVSGARARGRACLAFIDGLDLSLFAHDRVARGYNGLWRANFIFMLEDDLSLALELIQQSLRDLEDSQVLYRLSLAYTVQAFIWWGLGQHARSEQMARRARAVAEQVHDGYHAARGAWYLALALSETSDPARLAEAEVCAAALQLLRVNPVMADASARTIAARVALSRGDWQRAAREAQAARAGWVGYPPFYFMTVAHLLTGLLRQGGHADEAAAVAREDLALLAQLGSPICSEVMFRVVAAEALLAAGDRRAAEQTLAEALLRIERRAASIHDPELRTSYLENREENRRARALASAWAVTAAAR